MYKNLNKNRRTGFLIFCLIVAVLNLNTFHAVQIDENTEFETIEVHLNSITINKPKFKKGFSISIYSMENQEYKFGEGYSSCVKQYEIKKLKEGDILTIKYLNYYDWRSLINDHKHAFDLQFENRSLIRDECIKSESSSSKWIFLILSPILLFALLFFLNVGQKE